MASQQNKTIANDTTGVLLMGGQGQRMGGCNKGKLVYQAHTFAALALQVLSLFPTVISARETTQDLPAGYPVVYDAVDAGPLGAIYSVLQSCQTEYILVLSCDMPRMTQAVVLDLLAQAQAGCVGAIPMVNGQLEPMCGLYSKKMLPYIEQALAQNRYALRGMLEASGVQYIDESQFAPQFLNLNHWKDYLALIS